MVKLLSTFSFFIFCLIHGLYGQNCEETCGEYPGAAYRDPGTNPCQYAETAEDGIEKRVAKWECCCKKLNEKKETEGSMDAFFESVDQYQKKKKAKTDNSNVEKNALRESNKSNNQLTNMRKQQELMKMVTEEYTNESAFGNTTSPYDKSNKRPIPISRLGVYKTKKKYDASRGCNELQKTLVLTKKEIEWTRTCSNKTLNGLPSGKWRYIPQLDSAMVDLQGNFWMENLNTGEQFRIEFREDNIWIRGADALLYYKQ